MLNRQDIEERKSEEMLNPLFQPPSIVDLIEADRNSPNTEHLTEQVNVTHTVANDIKNEMLPLYALAKQALSISPNDVCSAICVMVAASFMAHLNGLSTKDSASVGTICATAYTVACVVGGAHQIAALFTIRGITVEENVNQFKVIIAPTVLKESLVQLIKIGVIDSILASAFLLSVPSIYGLLGTASHITQVSQDFVNIAAISLYPQVLNTGLQQTLFKMDKHKQLVHGALYEFFLTLGSLLISQFVWGPLNDVQNIALSFTIGAWGAFAFYVSYLLSKNLMPNLEDFKNYLFRDPNSICKSLFYNGNPIAVQLFSELFAVILMPIMATWLIKKEYLTDALSILNFANITNLTAVVPPITLAQAGCNLMDSFVRLYREHPDDKYLNDIRRVADTTLRGGLIYNAIVIAVLVPAAYQIASFFYNPKEIDMPGISNNPYILSAIMGGGLLINSRRDLCLFMLRSVGIFKLAAASSIISLWCINIPAAIALCTAPWKLNIAGILLAYYGVGIPLGALFLRHKLDEALSEKNLPILLDSEHPKHNETVNDINRIIPKWCSQWPSKRNVNNPSLNHSLLEENDRGSYSSSCNSSHAYHIG